MFESYENYNTNNLKTEIEKRWGKKQKTKIKINKTTSSTSYE